MLSRTRAIAAAAPTFVRGAVALEALQAGQVVPRAPYSARIVFATITSWSCAPLQRRRSEARPSSFLQIQLGPARLALLAAWRTTGGSTIWPPVSIMLPSSPNPAAHSRGEERRQGAAYVHICFAEAGLEMPAKEPAEETAGM